MSILLHKILFITQKSHGFAAALLLFIGNVLRTLSDDIRSPLAYAYAELNAHGARHARPLSFARMEVLRTSQEEQIELSLSLDFLRFAQRKRSTAYPAADLFVLVFCVHKYNQKSIIKMNLVHFFCCENWFARLN